MATWIFLRGLGRDSRHWGKFVSQFKAEFPLDKVIALDLPGTHLLNRQSSPTSIAAMVDCYRSQLKQKGISSPYRILALSMGAMVCAEWSQRYPQEVQAQVLVNTSMRPFSPFHQRLRLSNFWMLCKFMATNKSSHQWERFIFRLTSNCASDAVIADWCRYRDAFPVSRKNALAQLFAAARYRATRRAPVVPTLVLTSEADRLVNVQCSKVLALTWGVPIELHPTAGHDLPLDDGKWVVEKIAAWVQDDFLTIQKTP